MTPASGPIGTRVTFEGRVPKNQIKVYAEDWFDHPSSGLTADFPKSADFPVGCELLVTADPFRIHLNRTTGAVHGSFVVGDSGTCFQSAGTIEENRTHRPPPGTYRVNRGALASYIAEFQVTEGSTLPFTGTSPVPLLLIGIACVGTGALVLSRYRA